MRDWWWFHLVSFFHAGARTVHLSINMKKGDGEQTSSHTHAYKLYINNLLFIMFISDVCCLALLLVNVQIHQAGICSQGLARNQQTDRSNVKIHVSLKRRKNSIQWCIMYWILYFLLLMMVVWWQLLSKVFNTNHCDPLWLKVSMIASSDLILTARCPQTSFPGLTISSHIWFSVKRADEKEKPRNTSKHYLFLSPWRRRWACLIKLRSRAGQMQSSANPR